MSIQRSFLTFVAMIPPAAVLAAAPFAIDLSRSLFAYLPSMVPATAACLLLLGAGNIALKTTRSRALRFAPPVLVLVIALRVLLGYFFSAGVLPDGSGEAPTPTSPQSLAALSALAAAQILFTYVKLESRRVSRITFQILVIFSLGVCGLAGLGYVYSITGLFGLSNYVGMSVLTAFSAGLLAADLLAVDRRFGIARAISQQNSAGFFLRRFLTAGVLAPFVLAGIIRWVEVHYGVGSTYGMAAFVFFTVASLLCLGAVTAYSLERVERQKINLALKEIEIGEVNEAGQLRDKFLANMSHEVRTPLTAVLGYLDFLDDAEMKIEDRLLFTRRAQRSARTLVRVLDDILDLSRITADHLKVRDSEFSLSELVEDVLSQYFLEADRKGIRLRAGAVPGGNIVADMTRVQQILTNLISNAVKFTDHGEIRLSARISSEGPRTWLVIDVSDTGLGIAEKAQARIFQNFYQVDDSITRQHGGSGIGLALSAKLAHLLGGELHLRSSQPGVGSLFQLRIPCVYTAPPTKPSALPHSETSGLSRGLRILIVDDNPDNQFLISRILAQEGVEVDLAENGQIGAEKAEAKPYALILMDIQMPVMGGLEATRLLRTSGYLNPIVALSAHASAEHVARSLQAGCNLHLSKPIVRSDLMRAIKGLVANLV